MKRILLATAALLLLQVGNVKEALADCPAAPLTSTSDMVVSFLAANGTQAAPSTALASSVKEGMLVYDDTNNALKICNGTAWQTISVGGGGVTAAGTVAGAVQFRGATGNLEADDTNFVWDDTNNKLQINTAAPNVGLEMPGQSVIGLSRIYNHTTTYFGIGHKDLVTNGTAYAIAQSSGGNTIVNAATGTTVAVRIGGSGVQPVRIDSTGTTFTDGATAGAHHASALLDITSTTRGFLPPRMTTTDVGNIASPADGLMVYDTDTDTIKLRANGAWIDLLGGSGSEADPQVGTLTANKWCSANAGGTAIDCTADAPATGAAGSANEVQFRNNSTGAFAANSSFVWDDTNARLGVGVAAPNAALEVQRAGFPATIAQRNYTTDANTIRAVSSTVLANTGAAAADGFGPSIRFDIIDNATGADITTNAGLLADVGAIRTGANNSGALVFRTNAAGVLTEKVRIDKDGNVGIGTATPSAEGILTVKGSASLGIMSHNTTGGVLIGYGNGNTIQGRGANGVTNADLLLNNYGGNVGIGTTMPASKLQVAGGIQIGDDPAACPGAANVKLGTIRFNGGNLQLCGGGGWGTVSGGGGGTTLPNCADGETIVRSGGNWVCTDTPDVFAFTDLTGQNANTLVTSNILPVSGVLQSTVSISGTGTPQYRVCLDAGCSSVFRNWGSTPATINQGQFLQLRLTTAPATDGATRMATVQIGTISDAWSVTTQDNTPDAFILNDVTNQAASTVISSNTVTITGIGTNPTPVSVSGTGSPEISVAGGSWTTGATITAGQTLRVRLTSASTSSTMRSAMVVVGNTSQQWDVTTVPQDNTPVAFDFTDLTNQTFSTLVMSGSLSITDIGPDPVNVSVTGGGTPQISIAGGAWGTSGTILNGQTLQLRMTTSSASSTMLTATVTVGTGSDVWNVTTMAQDNVPDAFTFTDVIGQNLNALITSNTVTVTGIGPLPVSVSVTGDGSPQISIAGGAWGTSGTITSGQTLAVRLTSASTSNTARTATVTVGTYSDVWSVTSVVVSAGSQSFTTTGASNFTVPHYQSLTVTVWGGGGGGGGGYYGGNGGAGGAGSASNFNGAIIGNGGSAGAGTALSAVAAGGAGGTASGGSTNTTGQAGNPSAGSGSAWTSGKGGDAPSGGAGGAARSSNGVGNAGVVPGAGGGGGLYATSGGGGGGGSGGYSTRTYTPGQLTPGASLPVTVGTGGGGGSSGNGNAYRGGAGASGQVTVTWN